jgi:hypothetical protein
MARELGRDVVPPLHRPWDPDDSIDFHAARLLVLLRRCGRDSDGRVDGRTKLAKLDFFLRYPAFLQKARDAVRSSSTPVWRAEGVEVEAPMIRYRFGPWDTRYRQYLAFLEARKLVRVMGNKPERVALTAAGRKAADTLIQLESFAPIVDRCDAMAGNLADMSGSALKDLIYELFPREVGDLPMRAVITP